MKAIVLVNRSDLYNQFLKEMPELVGEEDFGYLQGKTVKWGNFMLVMVQSLNSKLAKYKHKLSEYEICLIDEADLGDNKTYKRVIQALYNTSVRVGLSGSIYMSKLKKDELKNENLRAFFGNEVFTITKREMVDLGFSTKLVIKIVQGSTLEGVRGDYQLEYQKCITENRDRAFLSVKRTKKNIRMGRLPAMVICQFHNHIELMYEIYQHHFGMYYKVAFVHHAVKNRKEILNRFAKGEIDILIVSFIIKRGHNLPLIKYIQNAAGSDSNETISQLMGRGERKHKSKNVVYMDDLYDKGYYLERHSKHRINYYKREEFKVKILV